MFSQHVLIQGKSDPQILVHGKRPKGVTAKDIILAIIGKIGIGGGACSEYGGGIRVLSMDGA
jgi:3-isopropylmalate/(R)-2-methylmalate dehydratase large subunit